MTENSLLLNRAGDWVAKDTEKAKVFNAFFDLVFTNKICFQDSQVHINIWYNEDLSEGGSD